MAITRPISATDIPGAVALNEEAGWNQVAADWQFMLDQGEATGIVDNDVLIATSMLLPQGDRFAWIAMILVTAARQRQGLASDLMRRCIARAEELNIIAGLDATEAGRKVYLPLGFQDIYPLTRWQADSPNVVMADGVRPMQASDLADIAALDGEISGAARAALLAHLYSRCPERAFVLEGGGRIRGFVLARDGRMATQIGPLSAETEADALSLLQAALAVHEGAVFLDAADHHEQLSNWLGEVGFTKQRGYMRMLLGRDRPMDDPARVFLIAGPELG